MNLWIASMECAGIVEAGGVKNVTYSLCKEFKELGHNVTLFIPVYKCNSWSLIKNYTENFIDNIQIDHCEKKETLAYSKAQCIDGNFNIIFINHLSFENKEAVYTYTENEEKLNPIYKKGCGHIDSLFMDSIFAKSIVKYAEFISEKERPDIIHCQDASTALIPSFAKRSENLKKAKCVVTIHNAGPAYHHEFSNIDEAMWYTGFSYDDLKNSLNKNSVEPFLLAANDNAYLTTVSEDYAKELINPDYDEQTQGLASLFNEKSINIKGITNGIDFERYDPRDTTISCLPYSFSPEDYEMEGKYLCRDYLINTVQNVEKIPNIKKYGHIKSESSKDVFICYHGRITSQKGLNILLNAIPVILNNFNNVKFIIGGQGESSLEKQVIELTEKNEGNIIYFNGYNKETARLINAVGDFIILPSYFEPCGLEDFISQLYGTLPIAHATGGLKKIVNYKTGFLYSNNTTESLISKISEVVTIKNYSEQTIKKMIKYSSVYVRNKYLWKTVVKNEYLKFFNKILKKS